jgi:hypothetical protein
MNALSHNNLAAIKQKVAYHEAGHATAIQINNRLQKLPPVFFQILVNDRAKNAHANPAPNTADYFAKLDGGRLVQSLPPAVNGLDQPAPVCDSQWTRQYTNEYHLAFEADIINMLIGPLAEAKYCAQMDNEPFSQQLLTVQALKYYGGETDLAVANDYLQRYFANKQQQNERLKQFFIQAFNFVNSKANWKAISQLADYILASNKNAISCDEVTLVIGTD